jgi:hypothetical protein
VVRKIELTNEIPVADGFATGLADNTEIEKRWDQVQATMRAAFDDATYFELGRTVENGIRHIGRALRGELDCTVGHAVAVDRSNDEVVGGIFCVPTSRHRDQADADIGWVFVGRDVPIRVRPRVMDGLVACVMTTLVETGYSRLVTRMGSAEGANMLGRRYSIAQEPLPGQDNRWVGSCASLPEIMRRLSA